MPLGREYRQTLSWVQPPEQTPFPSCTEIHFSYLLQLFQALRNVEGYVDQRSVGLILQNKSKWRAQPLLD